MFVGLFNPDVLQAVQRRLFTGSFAAMLISSSLFLGDNSEKEISLRWATHISSDVFFIQETYPSPNARSFLICPSSVGIKVRGSHPRGWRFGIIAQWEVFAPKIFSSLWLLLKFVTSCLSRVIRYVSIFRVIIDHIETIWGSSPRDFRLQLYSLLEVRGRAFEIEFWLFAFAAFPLFSFPLLQVSVSTNYWYSLFPSMFSFFYQLIIKWQ